jgi:hypothetical protein
MESIFDITLEVEANNEGDQARSTPKLSKAKYKQYTLERKVAILALLDEKNNNATEVERATGIDRRRILEWAKHRFAIESANNRRERSRLEGAGRKAKFAELEPRVCFRA